MKNIPYNIAYTICFCIAEDQILMLYRNKEPNLHLWNGIGGKIEAGETHKQAIIREVHEEANIILESTDDLHFAGVITWHVVKSDREYSGGMYAYVAFLSKEKIWIGERKTAEGILDWKNPDWVFDENNSEVVENIPHFLPEILRGEGLIHFHCEYSMGKLKNFSFEFYD